MRLSFPLLVLFGLTSSFAATTRLQITAPAVDLQAGTSADGAVTLFSTYSATRTPLAVELESGLLTSGELRLRNAATGTFETDYILSNASGPIQYGALVFDLPTTDENGNGLMDFFELPRSVSQTISGTATADQPAAATGTVTGTFTRAAGVARGTYQFSITLNGATRVVDGAFVLVTSFADATTAVYTRGTPNTLVLNFQMTSEEGLPGPFSHASTQFTVPSPNTLAVDGFTFTDSNDWSYTVQSTTFTRTGTRYIGSVELVDGSIDTPWGDFKTWHVEIDDPNDTDGDGIPDLSDELPTTQPLITTQPVSLTVQEGAPAQFTVAATGGSLGYAWFFNNTAIPHASHATLSLNPVRAVDAGTYHVVVSNATGSVTSAAVTLTVQPAPGGGGSGGGGGSSGGGGGGSSGGGSTGGDGGGAGGGSTTAELVNLAVRARTAPGSGTLILGCAVSGRSELLIRGIGPGLVPMGLTEGYVADPVLTLYSGSQVMASNDNWGTSESAITAASVATGASALGTGSTDAALLQDVENAVFTAHVTAGAPGVALADIFWKRDSGGGRLTNLASRAFAGTAEQTLIAGFVIAGEGQLRLLLRGVGPSLADQGVPAADVLADPELVLFRGQEVIGSNDDWDAADAAAMASVNAGTLRAGSRDAAMIVTLGAGVYTLHVQTKGSSGIALAEIFVLP